MQMQGHSRVCVMLIVCEHEQNILLPVILVIHQETVTLTASRDN